MPNSKGVKNATGKTLIALEDYKMQPGDVIAHYATAKDARITSRTDMMFIEGRSRSSATTRNRSRAAAGRRWRQADDRSEISQRAKRNHRRHLERTARQRERQSRRERAVPGGSANEIEGTGPVPGAAFTQPRTGGSESGIPEFREGSGSGRSRNGSGVRQAERPELERRAGPRSRRPCSICCAPKPRSAISKLPLARGGGGGGGQDAGRDLASMFDLELDREKNQYETGQNSGRLPQEQRQKDADEALQRLSESRAAAAGARRTAEQEQAANF